MTQNITYGGRYLVYFPYGRRIRFSRKLDLVVQRQLAEQLTTTEEGILYRRSSKSINRRIEARAAVITDTTQRTFAGAAS